MHVGSTDNALKFRVERYCRKRIEAGGLQILLLLFKTKNCMKIISGILILITAFLSFKHGWSAITNNASPQEAEMFTQIGITKPLSTVIGILSFAVGVMVLFPKTFFVGNIVNAVVILLIMALSLRAGNMRIALIEIPFLLIPLLMIYLGHPLAK